jgi:hypothetical protein
MRRTLALVMMAMLTTLIAKADDPGNHRLSLAHKTEVTIAGMKLKRFDSDFAEDGHAVTFETFSGPLTMTQVQAILDSLGVGQWKYDGKDKDVLDYDDCGIAYSPSMLSITIRK